VMELMEEIAAKHGLACLLQEKPFQGVNGSGKHNNFSLATDTGLNLFNAPQSAKLTGGSTVFATIMSAVVQAIHTHGDLMRMAIASPGNDFRLGACEAPPAIVSTYLGQQLTDFLQTVKETKKVGDYVPETKTINVGVESIAPFTVPAEDRNRTSPFPYGGHRFEFRAVGSSQNVSMVNTVLCTMLADSFGKFASEIEAGKAAVDVAASALSAAWPVIFNGNGYSTEWPIEAEKRGIWRIDSGVEAAQQMASEKNVALFNSQSVMTEDETKAHCETMHEQYVGQVLIEAMCMVEMIKTKIHPTAVKCGLPQASDLQKHAKVLAAAIGEIEQEPEAYGKAKLARVLRLEKMEAARGVCDAAEAECPASEWPLATYQELLFLDFTQDGI